VVAFGVPPLPCGLPLLNSACPSTASPKLLVLLPEHRLAVAFAEWGCVVGHGRATVPRVILLATLIGMCILVVLAVVIWLTVWDWFWANVVYRLWNKWDHRSFMV
jgi:hypothetical protein